MSARAQPVQMESAALPCTECKGEGTKTIRALDCNHGGSCCPCDTGEVPCDRCEGSKVEPCDHCGEPSTRRDWMTDQPICADCGTGEDDEPGDDYLLGCEYDRPAEYREQMESARALK